MSTWAFGLRERNKHVAYGRGQRQGVLSRKAGPRDQQPEEGRVLLRGWEAIVHIVEDLTVRRCLARKEHHVDLRRSLVAGVPLAPRHQNDLVRINMLLYPPLQPC
jgi:hypothetical protein